MIDLSTLFFEILPTSHSLRSAHTSLLFFLASIVLAHLCQRCVEKWPGCEQYYHPTFKFTGTLLRLPFTHYGLWSIASKTEKINIMAFSFPSYQGRAHLEIEFGDLHCFSSRGNKLYVSVGIFINPIGNVLHLTNG